MRRLSEDIAATELINESISDAINILFEDSSVTSVSSVDSVSLGSVSTMTGSISTSIESSDTSIGWKVLRSHFVTVDGLASL